MSLAVELMSELEAKGTFLRRVNALALQQAYVGLHSTGGIVELSFPGNAAVCTC